MSDIPQKRCIGPCGQLLPATTEFFRRVRDRLRSSCKECERAYDHGRIRSPEAKERRRQQQKNWDRRREEQKRAYGRAYSKAQRLSQYDLTHEEYQALLEQQGYVCAICKKAETIRLKSGEPRALAIDHCHKTGKVRGLLCQACNTALGLLEDDIERIQMLLAYLQAS